MLEKFMESAVRLGTTLFSARHDLVVPIAAFFGPLLAIFNAPAFIYLMAFTLIDAGTGLWKAMVLKKMASNRFGDVFTRMVMYTIIYVILHGLTAAVPALAVMEGIVLAGYMVKEALSILENLKAIQLATGRGPSIDLVLQKLGLDMGRILKEVETSEVESIKTRINTLKAPPAPSPDPAHTPESGFDQQRG